MYIYKQVLKVKKKKGIRQAFQPILWRDKLHLLACLVS